MVFIFWQGIISIHQKAFLESLALQPGVGKVMLVVEEEITQYRKDMGWEVPVINNIELKIGPNSSEIADIVTQHKTAIHVMGGIRVGNMITAAFDQCTRQGCRMGIMTEPYNKAGYKGFLRTLKYQYYRLRYFNHIQFILAIGRQGVAQYKSLGYERSNIYPWAYFISLNTADNPEQTKNTIRRIIYAGRLEEAKGIARFTEQLIKSGNNNYSLDIYGEGPDEPYLRKLAKDNNVEDKISFFPFLKYEELLTRYNKYDWVVLPSTQKDGWGVIISEGLLNGLKAIVSGICGVSWVIKSGYNGEVFDWHTEGSCKQAINKMLTGNGYAGSGEITNWAENAISGDAGAAYFLNIIVSVYAEKTTPVAPWLK